MLSIISTQGDEVRDQSITNRGTNGALLACDDLTHFLDPIIPLVKYNFLSLPLANDNFLLAINSVFIELALS